MSLCVRISERVGTDQIVGTGQGLGKNISNLHVYKVGRGRFHFFSEMSSLLYLCASAQMHTDLWNNLVCIEKALHVN